MKTRTAILFAAALIAIPGCSVPQWRVGQAEVPEPLPLAGEDQLESWRQGADYVSRNIEEPPAAVEVSQELSRAIGPPKNPEPDPEKVIKRLRRELAEARERQAELRRELERHAGKPIEGTGVNLFGFASSGIVIAVVILLVIFPPAFSVVAFVARRMQATATSIVHGIEEWTERNPQAGQDLRNHLSRGMDRKEKRTVRKIKSTPPPALR